MHGTCIKTKHTSLFVFDKWGENLSHKKDVVQLQHENIEKCFCLSLTPCCDTYKECDT